MAMLSLIVCQEWGVLQAAYASASLHLVNAQQSVTLTVLSNQHVEEHSHDLWNLNCMAVLLRLD